MKKDEKQVMDESGIVLYNVEDIQRIFRLSRSKTYQLVSQKGFPAVRLNRKIYVPKNKLEQWIEKNCGKTFSY